MPKKLQFLVCINNKDYPASLEMRKLYQVLPDPEAESHQMVRVIDESGEDYLFPAEMFVHVELPKVAIDAFSVAA